jgi:hypothetical protein
MHVNKKRLRAVHVKGFKLMGLYTEKRLKSKSYHGKIAFKLMEL